MKKQASINSFNSSLSLNLDLDLVRNKEPMQNYIPTYVLFINIALKNPNFGRILGGMCMLVKSHLNSILVNLNIWGCTKFVVMSYTEEQDDLGEPSCS